MSDKHDKPRDWELGDSESFVREYGSKPVEAPAPAQPTLQEQEQFRIEAEHKGAEVVYEPAQPTTVVHVPIPEGNESRYVEVLQEQSQAAQPVAEPSGRQWVIVADGEGAQAKVIVGNNLEQSVHDFMCRCGKPWNDCQSGGTPESIRLMADDDEWATDEDGQKFSITWKYETGSTTLYKLAQSALPPSSSGLSVVGTSDGAFIFLRRRLSSDTKDEK